VTGRETFELPTSRQWEFLIINGLIGTVVSELLWLWGCFLTSSLVRLHFRNTIIYTLAEKVIFLALIFVIKLVLYLRYHVTFAHFNILALLDGNPGHRTYYSTQHSGRCYLETQELRATLCHRGRAHVLLLLHHRRPHPPRGLGSADGLVQIHRPLLSKLLPDPDGCSGF